MSIEKFGPVYFFFSSPSIIQRGQLGKFKVSKKLCISRAYKKYLSFTIRNSFLQFSNFCPGGDGGKRRQSTEFKSGFWGRKWTSNLYLVAEMNFKKCTYLCLYLSYSPKFLNLTTSSNQMRNC